MILVAKVTHQLRQRREETQCSEVNRTQGEDGAAEVDNRVDEHDLQLVHAARMPGGAASAR